MKRVYFLLLTFFVAGSVAFGQMPGDTESMIPADVNMFMKTRELSKVSRSLNFIVFGLLGESERGGMVSSRNSFRDMTGIDFLDEMSLANAGVDTSRPVSFANFNRDTKDNVRVLFIPVVNEKEAPLRFIELVRKVAAGRPEVAVDVVSVSYKNITVYQVTGTIYTASMNGYLLIGSTGDILRRVIDVRDSRSGSLMHDVKYRDYIARGKNGHELNVFITADFFKEAASSAGRDVKTGYGHVIDLIPVSGDAAGKKKGFTLADSIDYVAAGFTADGNRILMNASAKFVADNPYIDILTGFLKTGVQNQSLYVPLADSNMYLSMNLRYLDNLCKGEIDWCASYNELKQQIMKGYGIDLERDFIPYHTGGINIFSIDSATAGGVGDVLLFIPMIDGGKTGELWGKIKKGMQTRFGAEKRFGEEKIGNRNGFWYIDQKRVRYFVSYDRRGIYAGNNTSLMKSVIDSPAMESAVNTGRYGKLINDKTFFLLNIKKNTLVRAMLEARARDNAELSRYINRIGELFIYCERRDGGISINVEAEIKEPGIKK